MQVTNVEKNEPRREKTCLRGFDQPTRFDTNQAVQRNKKAISMQRDFTIYAARTKALISCARVIIISPLLDGDVPRRSSYGVYIS